MPGAAFSIETTRSRRRWKVARFGARKSCGPDSASSAAYCATEQGFDVLCDCTVPMALIRATGPAA